jgi:hypothetical protein
LHCPIVQEPEKYAPGTSGAGEVGHLNKKEKEKEKEKGAVPLRRLQVFVVIGVQVRYHYLYRVIVSHYQLARPFNFSF